MFKKDSKYRLHYLIVMIVLSAMVTIFKFYDFYEKKNGMSMIGGIVFGLMMIVYVFDLFEFFKNKKCINS